MRALKVACAGLCAIGLASAASAAPFQIREAWVAPGNWSSIWSAKKDLARHFGQSYELDPVHYVGTPPMITALANNQIEIANLAYSTLGIAIENAGLTDMRVVADEFQDGVDDYYSEEYMVLKNGPIKKVEDLKGRVVATNAAGSAVDVAMKAMLHKHGLEPNRDYTVVEAPLPAMKAMLAERKVDLIPSVLPFSYDPELRRVARDLFVQKEAIGVSDMIVWCTRQSMIDQHRISSRIRCASCIGTSIPPITKQRWISSAVSLSGRRRVSTGCLPSATFTTTPTCGRTSTRCKGTLT